MHITESSRGLAFHNTEVETRDPADQKDHDRAQYRQQLTDLFARSAFYQQKLVEAGFPDPKSVGELDDIANLPFTVKDELRQSQAEHPPLGSHVAADWDHIVRVYSTSGTTGDPCFIAITARDLDLWTEISARTYVAAGIQRGRRVVHNLGAGPFVAGATTDMLLRAGITLVPVGTGNTERMMRAIRRLGVDTLLATPSFALYLTDWCEKRGIDMGALGIQRMALAGEPGVGDPVIRERLQSAFGCTVTEAMGIGDISISLWGECYEQRGMHFSGRDFVHFELINPDTGATIPLEDEAKGELVYTALQREAMPLLRFRSRDHVVLNLQKCSCGRTSPRVRCIGRTDDMLIVRGVNVFPSAVRAVVNRFAPAVGAMQIRPGRYGVQQDPPLRILVEVAPGCLPTPEIATRIKEAIRAALIITTEIAMVPHGTLPRSEYKGTLVDYTDAKED
jgi:phenylacetate-CoA ligase